MLNNKEFCYSLHQKREMIFLKKESILMSGNMYKSCQDCELYNPGQPCIHCDCSNFRPRQLRYPKYKVVDGYPSTNSHRQRRTDK